MQEQIKNLENENNELKDLVFSLENDNTKFQKKIEMYRKLIPEINKKSKSIFTYN